MDQFRREFLKLASGGLLGGFAAMAGRFIPGARAQNAIPMSGTGPAFDVRDFGAAGDGRTIDTAAVNRAIDAAAEAGGGIVRFRAGIYGLFHLFAGLIRKLSRAACRFCRTSAHFINAVVHSSGDVIASFFACLRREKNSEDRTDTQADAQS